VGKIVGASSAIRQLRQQVAEVASWDVNLVLQGDSGTGKELVARTVHALSDRRDKPFVAVNCAAINETLVESQLFGHEAGAFTDARHASLGFFRAADGGTILLDEIGDMSPRLQTKLLRVLEDRAVVPVGGTEPVAIDVRVIAATNCDLAEAVRKGHFRRDLYYRLNVIRLWIPPLRERRCDIPELASHMLGEMADVLKMPAKEFSPAAVEVLMRHDWPGNVRELGNIVQRAYVLGGPIIRVEDLPEELRGNGREHGPAPGNTFPTLKQAARAHVEQALALAGGVRTLAARMLGVDRKSLYRMMRRYGID
jgi:DNA-binding NtrC family response regulator